jgi:Ca2+-binding RTX toxin-like protein
MTQTQDVSFKLVQWGGSGSVSIRVTAAGEQFNLTFEKTTSEPTIVVKVWEAGDPNTATTVGDYFYNAETNTYTLYVASSFDVVTVANMVKDGSNVKFGLNTFTYDISVVQDLTLNFDLSTTDRDGDTATLADSLAVAMLNPNETISVTSDPAIDAMPGVMLVGNGENDILTGGAGDDILIGDGGNDTLNGMGGADTASYADAGAGVTVNLSLTTAQDTVGSGSDTLTNIENIIGSSHGDTLTGTSGANVLTGGAGGDMLIGGLGNDTLIGGDGSDTFKWNLGETGADKITDFTLGAGGDVLDLKDLLVGENADAASLEAYLNFSANGLGQTVITVDANAGTDGGTGQSITLENVQYSDLQSWAGDTSDTAIIAKLLTEGNLKTDL